MMARGQAAMFGNQGRLRTWIAWMLQERRRARAVPNAPSNLSATDNVTDVMLDWLDNSTDETGFRVYRNEVMVAERPAGSTSWDDTTVVVEQHYDYYVVAYNASGESARSNVVGVTVGA